jgi:cell division protein FtsB
VVWVCTGINSHLDKLIFYILLGVSPILELQKIPYSVVMSILAMATNFRRFLNKPTQVAITGLICLSFYLVLNGNLFRLWSLNRDFNRLASDISNLHTETLKIQGQLSEAKDPIFIEKQARDRLDLVSENDMVFVFADE